MLSKLLQKMESQLTENCKSFVGKELIDCSSTDLSQILSKIDEYPELVDVIGKWEKLSKELQGAVLRMVDV